MTEGDSKVRVVFEPTRRDAETRGATRTVSGWLESRDGGVRVHGTVRDEVSNKSVRAFDTIVSPGTDFARVAAAIASQTGAPLRNVVAPKPEAALAYERASMAGTPQDVLARLDEALQIDPGYGTAAVQKAEFALATGARDAAAQAVDAARAARLSETEKTRLDIVSAQLQGSGPARIEAVKRLAAIQTASVEPLNLLVALYFEQQDFRSAAQAAEKLLELDPNSEDTLNRRAYAYAFAGDLPAARKAFEDYRKRRPQSANAVDSLAEVLFYFRRYDEAAGLFLEAHRMSPAILNGAEPFRAALSYSLAGNQKEADTQIGKYFEQHKADPLLPLRRAIWMRMTARSATMPMGAPGLAMESLYALRDGDRTKAAQLAGEARKLVTNPAEASLAVMAGVMSQPSASAEEWRRRMEGATADPQQSRVRTELLGWALLLDKKYKEAADVWRPLFQHTSALESNDLRMLLFWSLAEGGNKEEARKVMPNGWLPPVGPEPGVSALFYPRIPELFTKL